MTAERVFETCIPIDYSDNHWAMPEGTRSHRLRDGAYFVSPPFGFRSAIAWLREAWLPLILGTALGAFMTLGLAQIIVWTVLS